VDGPLAFFDWSRVSNGDPLPYILCLFIDTADTYFIDVQLLADSNNLLTGDVIREFVQRIELQVALLETN
jgi:hypothetical protein